jgi:hypothetical protein
MRENCFARSDSREGATRLERPGLQRIEEGITGLRIAASSAYCPRYTRYCCSSTPAARASASFDTLY